MISVLLLDFGGPQNLKEVRPFLKNLFSDRAIMPMPAQNLMATLIAFLRAPKVAKHYTSIGGGSPLPKQSKEIAQQLEKSLQRANLDIKVFVGMRYSSPFIEETLSEIAKLKPQGMIILPMFPHYSTATTLSVLQAFHTACKNLKVDIPFQIIEWWHDQPDYIAAWVYNITKALDRFAPEIRAKVPILFSAHSLPESFVRERKDPYPQQIKECCEKIMTYLGTSNPSYLSYQSRLGPIEWLKPATIEFVKRLAAQGTKHLLIVPISFLTDHIETLYEIDREIIPTALEGGMMQVVRAEALYYSPHLKKALEGMILRKLPALLRENYRL